MINNNRQKDNKADKQSWIDVFARTQKLRTTGDESWKKDVPNIKLSRAFIVVLILHVVAVGGILAFELFKPDEAKLTVMTEQAVDEKLDDKNVIDEKKERRIAGDLSGTGAFNKYIVQKGDSIRAIAESFKVSRTEILEVNLIDEGHPLVSGRILRIPKPKMSISGDDIVIGDPVDDSDDFVSIEELTVDANNNGDITLESEDEVVKGSDENDGFQLLTKSDPKVEDEIIPRAIPVSAETDRVSAKVVKEIPANALITNNSFRRTNPESKYIIEQGDTLYGIAKKHKVGIDDILKLNPGVNPRALGIGRALLMP